jgi:hypothetical protein
MAGGERPDERDRDADAAANRETEVGALSIEHERVAEGAAQHPAVQRRERPAHGRARRTEGCSNGIRLAKTALERTRSWPAHSR